MFLSLIVPALKIGSFLFIGGTIVPINGSGLNEMEQFVPNHKFLLPPFSLLRDFSFQNTSEHFAIRFRQSYLIWEVCDVTAIELSSKEY